MFIGLGFTASAIGQFFKEYNSLIRQIGAILIIVFGLMVAGIIKPAWVMSNHKMEFKNRPSGFLGSFLIGIAFAAGWTPCTGPILGQ